MRRRFVRTAVLGLAAAALPATAAGLPGPLGGVTVQPTVPVVMSDNVELLGTLPDTTAVSMAFASDEPIAYLNTLTGITTLDISNPAQPVPLGRLAMPHFENEAMALGERPDGTKFVLVGVDIFNVAPTATGANHVSGGSASFLVVVDVTDPAAPKVASQLDVPTSTHTISCVTKTCEFAYTSGAYNAGDFDVVDLRNIRVPLLAKSIKKGNVAALPAGTAVNGNHQWDADDSGVLWASGGAGAAAFDVSDPLNPKTLASTNEQAYKAPYNDFIMHNSLRPGAQAFTQVRDEATGRLVSGSKATAKPADGNVLLLTEEDYDSPDCQGTAGVDAPEGGFSTWYVPYVDAAQYKIDNPGTQKIGKGKIEPLDTWNSEIAGTGRPTVAGALCSAHYFTFNNSGFVAQGWYQQGARILDVRDPRNIKQVAYFFAGASEVWHTYWVPEYKDGKQTGRTSNLVYTNDVVRGIDVLRIKLPSTEAAATPELVAPVLPQWLAGPDAVAPTKARAAHVGHARTAAGTSKEHQH